MVCTLTYIIEDSTYTYRYYIYAHTFRSIKHYYEPKKTTFPTQAYGSDIRGSWMSIPMAKFCCFFREVVGVNASCNSPFIRNI